MNQNRLKSTIILCGLAFALSACSHNSTAPGSHNRAEHKAPYSIVSSGNSSTDISEISTYALMLNRDDAHGVPRLGGVPVQTFLHTAINSAMAAKRYQRVNALNARSLLVGYHLVLGDSESGDPLGKSYGQQPGLQSGIPVEGHHEKGTLIIIVEDSATGGTIWRSALEGFADLNIPADVRQKRINGIVKTMLAGLAGRH